MPALSRISPQPPGRHTVAWRRRFLTRAGPMLGFTLLELAFALGVVAIVTGVAVPLLTASIDDDRTAGAVRYLATRLQQVRMESVTRGTNVAMRFVADGGSYLYAVYGDGNRNGVLSREIQSGVDRQLHPPEHLADHFTRVDFGALVGLPPIDASSVAPGSDPVRLGSSNMVSFTPLGTSTSGSLYLLGRGGAQYAIRIYGETGRTRVLKFEPRSRTWRGL
jgi:type II secretory pathway pseudopilin PulG